MKKIIEKLDVYLNNIKIKKKIFLLYFYCIMIPLVVTDTVICGMFIHDEEEGRKTRLKNMVKSVEYMLSGDADKAAALSENIYFNKYINEFLNQEFSSGLDYYNQYQELLKDSLFESSLGTSNVVITMYTDNPTVVNGGKFWKMESITNESWYQEFTQSQQEMQMYSYYDNSQITKFASIRKVSFVRKLNRYKRDPYEKLLKIDLDYVGINENLVQSNYEDEVYVCDGEKIIFSNRYDMNTQQDFEKITDVRRKEGEYVEEFSLFGQELEIYAVPQEDSFFRGIYRHWPAIALLISLNILIPYAMLRPLRRTFTDRLEILNKTLSYRNQGKLEEIQGIQGTDEIAFLMRNYNSMVQENNHLIETVYKSRLKQQEINIARQKAELLALHGQINPHFLFNVLENIRMRSVLKQEYETAEMIEQLSIMERQYVEWGTDLLTIQEESQFVESYLKLQKYRFGSRLSYSIEIQQECSGYKIPKLSLVTFVENACVHGIEDKAAHCWIFVKVFTKQDAGTVYNGQDAIDFLQDTQVDLILSDIKMPVMDGITLLKRIREEEISEAFFVILSGYGDFAYAQQAIKYKCTDYILKPIQRQQLYSLLEKVSTLYKKQKRKEIEQKKMGRAYFVRYIQALLLGRGDEEALVYVNKKLSFSDRIRYIHMELEDEEHSLEFQKMRTYQKAVYQNCKAYLGPEKEDLVFMDIVGRKEWLDIGFLYDVSIAHEFGMEEEEYLRSFLGNISQDLPIQVRSYVGDTVSSVKDISESFRTAILARSFHVFQVDKNILYYSEEKTEAGGKIINKASIEELLKAVEENDALKIEKKARIVYEELNQQNMNLEMTQMNMNYLLVNLVHLGLGQDDSLNQDEIIQYIRKNVFENSVLRGGKENFQRFMQEYGEYLGELRKNTSRGVLGCVEKEIRERYQENLTLKEFSKKYFVNSAYLGQMFRKQYGVSFKEYLNHYRIEKAADCLLHTDDKIYQIADKVGYRDLDYFINKFIAVKGCTPTNYRKKAKCGV